MRALWIELFGGALTLVIATAYFRDGQTVAGVLWATAGAILWATPLIVASARLYIRAQTRRNKEWKP